MNPSNQQTNLDSEDQVQVKTLQRDDELEQPEYGPKR